jgi:hypothetical protein
LDNTWVIYSSDHGYHLGSFALWAEKSQPYEEDVHIPFLVRGPGVTKNTTSLALASALDIGATILELSGAVAPGNRTTDGRSLVPLFAAMRQELGERERAADAGAGRGGGGATAAAAAAAVSRVFDAPAGWRDRVLIEYFGWNDEQYLGPCDVGSPFPIPNIPCPQPKNDTYVPLIDSRSNCYAALRILNSTHNLLYAEYRPPGSAPAPMNTNHTEAYDLSSDPFELDNVARGSGGLPPSVLAELSKELWAVATCAVGSCP